MPLAAITWLYAPETRKFHPLPPSATATETWHPRRVITINARFWTASASVAVGDTCISGPRPFVPTFAAAKGSIGKSIEDSFLESAPAWA
jgi:hypothetical protein